MLLYDKNSISGSLHQALTNRRPSRLMVSPWRTLTNSSTSAQCSSQTVRVPMRSEAGLTLRVQRIFLPAILYLITECNIVAYEDQSLPGSGQYDTTDERMLEVFEIGSIRRILHVRRRHCVPSVELRHRCLCIISTPALLVQGRPRCMTSHRLTGQGPTSAHTASHEAQTN